VIITQEVYAQAKAAYPTVGARELGLTYARWLQANQRTTKATVLTPPTVAGMAVAAVLRTTIKRIGPEPQEILRLRFHERGCGVGITLSTAARVLARQYAIRLVDTDPPPQLVHALLPCVILHCIYGSDPDPVAVELTRLALSLETDGVLPPSALDRHIIHTNTTSTARPPAMTDRANGIHVIPDTDPGPDE
jgi:hypothetical protein